MWPTKKGPGRYEVDLVLTAANFGRRFVTFEIDFKGGAWPADGHDFDAMYTARLVYQGRRPPVHPVRPLPAMPSVPRWFWVGGAVCFVLVATTAVVIFYPVDSWATVITLVAAVALTWSILFVIFIAALLVARMALKE